MAEIKKISTELQLLDKFLDTSGDAGTSGQVLTSTGTGINWVSGSGLPGGPYLPLTAGSTKPLTGDLYLTLSSSTQRALSSTGTNSLQIGDAGVQELKFKNASGTSFLINSLGNVGIGTASPGDKLQVAGNIIAQDYVYVGDGIQHWGDGGTGMNFPSNDNIDILTAGSSRMRIDSSGNVGIGTTSPNYALDISKDGGSILNLHRPNSSTAAASFLDFSFNTANATEAVYARIRSDVEVNTDSAQGGDLSFHTANAGTVGEVMRLTQEGSVGIGTTNINRRFQVEGGLASFQASGDTAAILLYPTSNKNLIYSRAGNTSSTAKPLGFVMGNTERVTIDTSGNVGIGTTSPAYPLSVEGDVDINGGELRIDQGNNIRFGGAQTLNADPNTGIVTIASHGSLTNTYINSNVGIGTNSPAEKLDVYGNIRINTGSELRFNNANVGAYRDSNDLRLAGYNSIQFLSSTTSMGSQTERMRITNAGRVGIGTTSPSKTLDVVGNANFTTGITAQGLSTIDSLGFHAINPVFGQPNIQLPDFTDVLYRADRRFTITITGGTNNVVGMFNGSYASGTTFAANNTHTVNINVAGQSGVPANGYTYPQGYLYFSFYSGLHAYTSLTARVKANGVWRNCTGATNISTNASYEVLRLTVPSNNYVTDIEFTLVTGASSVQIALMNYVSSRHTSQMELPYLSKTLDTNRLFGNVDVLTNTSADQNRLSGTGNSYLAANTGNVGIGTSSPSQKLEVAGVIPKIYLNSSNNTGGSILFDDNLSTGTEIQGSSGNIIFKQSGSEKMRIEAGGDVGIGTTNPHSILHISDANPEFILEDTTNPNKCKIKNNDGSLLYYADYDNEFGNSRHRFFIDGSEKLRIEANGNVGIGTTSPTSLGTNITTLDIQGSSGGGFRFGTTGGVEGGVYTISSGTYIGSISNVPLYLRTNNSTKATILANGNVGIDTTSPGSKLEVNGDITIADGNRLNIKSAGGTYTGYIEKDTYNATVNLGLHTTFTGARRIYINDGTNQRWEFGGATTGASDNIIAPHSNYSGSAIYAGHQGFFGFRSVGSTVAHNVMQLFDRADNNNHGVKLIYMSGGSYSDGLVLDNTGNVGIGTTSPGEKLEIANAGSVNLKLNNTSGGLAMTIGAQASACRITAESGDDLRLGAGGTADVLNINSSGNVGIGTTNPAALLDVNGNIQITGGSNTLIFDNSTVKWQQYVNTNEFTLRYYSGGYWNERLRVDTDGNVGIGTTNPEAKLHVTDSIRIDTGGAGPSAAPTTGTPTQAQVKSGGDETYYLSEPDTWLTVNIDGTDYVIPAYEA